MSSPFIDSLQRRELPPLRIHHLMLWTAVTAVMMTVMKAETSANRLSSQMHAQGIPENLIESLCLTGLVLGLDWRRRGYWFFDEPGQMAFVLQGLSAIYGLISSSITGYLSASPTSTESTSKVTLLLGVGAFVVGIITLVLYFRYSRRFQHCGKWGGFFRAVGIIILLQFVASFLVTFLFVFQARGNFNFNAMLIAQLSVPFVLGIIEVAYWVAVVREDFREETTYHWTHWVGASTWPLLRLVGLFSMIMLYFFPPDWASLVGG